MEEKKVLIVEGVSAHTVLRQQERNRILAAFAGQATSRKFTPPIPKIHTPASYVPVGTARTREAYVMNIETHEIRRVVPKKYRSKKERVAARRRAAKVPGW